MSRLGINTGANPNDGQGDSLRVAMGKVNSNFLELYTSFGNGFDLVSYASTAGISTLARNLTGSPIITVGGVISSGISSVETIQTTNLTVSGVVTATQFKGDGSQLTNVTASNPGVEIYDENIYRGVAKGINFGSNIISNTPDGSGRVTISVPSTVFVTGISSLSAYAERSGIATYASVSGVSTYSLTSGIATYSSTSGISTTSGYANRAGVATYATISGVSTIAGYATTAGISTYAINSGFSTSAGYATTSGVSTVAQGLTGTPNITVGIVTSEIIIPVQLRTRSVAEKTTLINGNTVGLAFTTGGGNVAICTNPSGDITLNVTNIPTDVSFDNHSISFSVVVNQTGTARTCTTITLNGVSRTIRWAGGSLANAISGVTTSTGFDIFTFTGINTVGSASTTSNYVILGSVNGGFN